MILVYDKTTDGVDCPRLELFARKQKSYEAIPSTNVSLFQLVKRSTYQAACIWGQATTCQMQRQEEQEEEFEF